jgi:hypothetical protein
MLTKRIIQRLNDTKSGFLEKIKKIDKPFTDTLKRETRSKLIKLEKIFLNL